MRVGAANTKRAYTCPPRPLGFPVSYLRVDKEGTVGKINLRIRLLEMQAGRQRAVLQTQHSLDQPGNSSGGIEMTNVRFEGPNGTEPFSGGLRLKNMVERGNFNGSPILVPVPWASM